MTLEFQDTLFRTASEMLDAVAEEWLTAGGSNSAADVEAALASSDEDLARECIAGWGLDQLVDPYDPELGTWMEARDVSEADLAAAFARYRAARG